MKTTDVHTHLLVPQNPYLTVFCTCDNTFHCEMVLHDYQPLSLTPKTKSGHTKDDLFGPSHLNNRSSGLVGLSRPTATFKAGSASGNALVRASAWFAPAQHGVYKPFVNLDVFDFYHD
jgi:hypothetical protein